MTTFYSDPSLKALFIRRWKFMALLPSIFFLFAVGIYGIANYHHYGLIGTLPAGVVQLIIVAWYARRFFKKRVFPNYVIDVIKFENGRIQFSTIGTYLIFELFCRPSIEEIAGNNEVEIEYSRDRYVFNKKFFNNIYYVKVNNTTYLLVASIFLDSGLLLEQLGKM